MSLCIFLPFFFILIIFSSTPVNRLPAGYHHLGDVTFRVRPQGSNGAFTSYPNRPPTHSLTHTHTHILIHPHAPSVPSRTHSFISQIPYSTYHSPLAHFFLIKTHVFYIHRRYRERPKLDPIWQCFRRSKSRTCFG